MKIDDVLKLQGLVQPERPRGEATARENFSEMLKEVQAKLNGAATAKPENLPPLAPVEVVTGVGSAEKGVQALEEGLNLLEKFAQGLGAGNTSLKDLAPLAAAMETDGRKLQDLAASLPGNSPLKAMAEEAAALAQVASLKFRRGDFQ